MDRAVLDAKTHELINILTEYEPEARAVVRGSRQYPGLWGNVLFYPFWNGSLVLAAVMGLPDTDAPCSGRMYGFHIHAGSRCSGTAEDPFADAGTHFNPFQCMHPAHAGDLPVLISNHGTVFQIFYTERFAPLDVIGRTVIIHLNADDFRTQPSGDSGPMIACGEINKVL